jgi:cellulose biosynthesis protein BcsQ
MKTLAILAQKGGSSKTTLAVHMAVCAMGFPIVIAQK